MTKQQVHVCDWPECEEHRGVETYVILRGALPRKADYCPTHAAPLKALWEQMPVPTERRFGRRTEVVSMEEVAAARRRASGRA